MKKVVLSLALAFTAILGNAQVVKNDLLNGYTEGNALEKEYIPNEVRKRLYKKILGAPQLLHPLSKELQVRLSALRSSMKDIAKKECLLCLVVSLRVQAVNAPQFIQWRKEELIHQEPIILPIL